MLSRPALHLGVVVMPAQTGPWRLHLPAHRRRPWWITPCLVAALIETVAGSAMVVGAARPIVRDLPQAILASGSFSGVPLLTPAAFGPGWVTETAQTAPEAASCFAPRAAMDTSDPATREAGGWADTPLGVPSATEIVDGYTTPAAASSAFESASAAMAGCSQFTTTAAGQTVEAEVAPAPVTSLTNHSAAYQVTVQLGSAVGVAYFVAVEKNLHVMLFIYDGSGGSDPAAVATLAAEASARL